jgi:hypothetical protein
MFAKKRRRAKSVQTNFRFDGGFENADVVDEVFPRDGIGRLAADGTSAPD